MSQLDNAVKQLRSLSLTAAASQLATLVAKAEANEISYLGFVQSLAEHELVQRNVNRIQRHFDYRHQTTVTKRQISGLLDFSFIDERQNLIFIGPPGVGKTHLAIGIGHEAIQAGYKVLFKSALALVEELELAEMKGELKKRLTQLGYLPMSRQSRYNLFQLINSLYEYRSIILTTNKDFTSWGEFFHDDNVAVPIIDRVIHHSHVFMLGGESYRLKQKVNKT